MSGCKNCKLAKTKPNKEKVDLSKLKVPVTDNMKNLLKKIK